MCRGGEHRDKTNLESVNTKTTAAAAACWPEPSPLQNGSVCRAKFTIYPFSPQKSATEKANIWQSKSRLPRAATGESISCHCARIARRLKTDMKQKNLSLLILI
jgi:hypothetical protein